MSDDLKEWLTFHGKNVGYILLDTYHTFRNYETFFKKYRGFGLSVELLEFLKRKGVKTVVIHYNGKRENSLFIAPLEKFFEGKTFVDRSAGFEDVQKHLSINDFKVVTVEKRGEV